MEMEQGRWAVAAEAAEWDRAGVADRVEAEWAGRLPPDPVEAAFVPHVAKSRRILSANPAINNNARSVGQR